MGRKKGTKNGNSYYNKFIPTEYFNKPEYAYGVIYIGYDLYNNLVYIGQTTNLLSRICSHFGPSNKSKFGTALKTYNENNFIFGVLGWGYSSNELDVLERECISFYLSDNNLYGYNYYPGHGCGKKENCPAYGVKKTEESRYQLRKTREERGLNLPENNPMYGKKHTKEARSKMSNASKSQVRTEERNKRQADKLRGRKHTKEHNENISKGHQKNKGKPSISRGVFKTLEHRKNISKGRQLNDSGRGKKNPHYIKINHEFLITEYFNIISSKELIEKYNENFRVKIGCGCYSKFLKSLNFPINSFRNRKDCKAIYLKFVEENKNKIDWYIENYERLEEEYYLIKKEKGIINDVQICNN